MRVLKDIKELLEDELKELKKKGTITPTELDSIHKVVETIKDIDEMCEKDRENEYEDEYSGRRMGRVNMNYSGTHRPMLDGPHYPAVYDNDYSWGEGRYSGRNQNRDSMGRYSSGYDRRYSRESATNRMIDKLEDMMNEASTENEREAIRNCINKLTW